MTRSIALIGSRRTSAKVNKMCFTVGFLIAASGRRGRSGGAPGPDTSFEMGAQAYHDMKANHPDMPGHSNSRPLEIYLPGYRFSNRKADESTYLFRKVLPFLDQAMDLASELHPNWSYLPDFARKLMARNSHQMLGPELNDPSDRVVCYTPDGATDIITSDTGGTGQALRLANKLGVPIDNLGDPETWSRYQNRIDKAKLQYAPWVDLDNLYEQTCKNHAPGFDLVFEDLLSDSALANTDVIVHGANCKHKMKSGFAKSLVAKFPEALEADLKTPNSIKKLGTYSVAHVTHNGRPLAIVNAYTQAAPANKQEQEDGVLVADYEAIRKVMGAVRKDFSGSRVSMPRVGAGLANGCWLSIGHIIAGAMYDQKVTVHDLPQRLNHERKFNKSQPQMGLF